jgi:hypothetical protein
MRQLARPSSAMAAAGSHRRAVFVALVLVAAIRRTRCEDQNPTAACSSELAAWAGCLKDSNTNGQWCADCYIDYFDFVFGGTYPPTCGVLTMQICNWIDACDFGCASSTCGPFIEAYELCHWGSDCFFGCPYSEPIPAFPTFPSSPGVQPPTLSSSSTFPPAVAPALAATSSECDDVVSEFTTCADTSGEGGTACLSCVNDYTPGAIGTGTCVEVELYACTAMTKCPVCGNCEAELISMVNCDKQGVCDTIACSTPAPAATAAPSAAPVVAASTPGPVASPPSPVRAPVSIPTSTTSEGEPGGDNGTSAPTDAPTEGRCPSELDDFQDCIATELTSADGASCGSCVSDALERLVAIAQQQAPSCSAVNEAICRATEGGNANDSGGGGGGIGGGCGCGTCADELQLYLGCSVDASTTGCELECDSPAVPSPSPSTSVGTIVGAVVAAGMVVIAAAVLCVKLRRRV